MSEDEVRPALQGPFDRRDRIADERLITRQRRFEARKRRVVRTGNGNTPYVVHRSPRRHRRGQYATRPERFELGDPRAAVCDAAPQQFVVLRQLPRASLDLRIDVDYRLHVVATTA